MTESAPLTRRTLVQIGGVSAAGAGALLLAACTPQGSGASSGSDSGAVQRSKFDVPSSSNTSTE